MALQNATDQTTAPAPHQDQPGKALLVRALSGGGGGGGYGVKGDSPSSYSSPSRPVKNLPKPPYDSDPQALFKVIFANGNYIGPVDVGVCQALLTQGVNIDEREHGEKDGRTALICAAAQGYPDCNEVVRVLVQAGALLDLQDVKRHNLGGTVLLVAAHRGEIVRELVRGGAALDVQDARDNTALRFAAGRGDTEVVREFVRGGAALDTQENTGTIAMMASTLVLENAGIVGF